VRTVDAALEKIDTESSQKRTITGIEEKD